MPPTHNRATEIFADAYAMHTDALRLLAANDIRDAADKAWCATLRSSDALILARTGVEPQLSPVTTRMLRQLGEQDAQVQSLLPQYFTNQETLHGQCFYLGLCQPAANTELLIRQTITYVQDTENLAFNPAPPL